MIRRVASTVAVAALLAAWQTPAAQTQTPAGQAQKPKAATPQAPQKPGSTAPAAKPAAQKASAPETPEKAQARMRDACSLGDFKACVGLRDAIRERPDAVPPAPAGPASIVFKGATPVLAPGTVWAYRAASIDPAFDNRLIEIALSKISEPSGTFTVKVDGTETTVTVNRSKGTYFSPHVTADGKLDIVAERVPDDLKEGVTWRLSPMRRFKYDAAGNMIGQTLEGEAVTVTGPVLHSALGKAWPGVRVARGDQRLVMCADLAFAVQALITTPDRPRVLFNLESLREPGAAEQTAPPAIDSATWARLERWMTATVSSPDFARVIVESLVAHVNERPQAQLAMIGGTLLTKSPDGACVLWGHKGLVTRACDARALGVGSFNSQSFILP